MWCEGGIMAAGIGGVDSVRAKIMRRQEEVRRGDYNPWHDVEENGAQQTFAEYTPEGKATKQRCFGPDTAAPGGKKRGIRSQRAKCHFE
jgi:hypothetical protein